MTCHDYITAAFSRDFVAEGYDHDTVERIHHGVFDEWIHALAQSGLFTNHAVANAPHRWKDNPHSLLDALLAAGVPVEYDCRHGSWGRCTQRVLEGEPAHRDAQYGGMPAQSEWIRICVSRARSATLVLDL